MKNITTFCEMLFIRSSASCVTASFSLGASLLKKIGSKVKSRSPTSSARQAFQQRQYQIPSTLER